MGRGETAMLDQPASRREVQGFYAGAATTYDEMTAEHEAKPKARALELLDRRPGERYLEVAVGTGLSFAAVVEQSGLDEAFGVDMTIDMIEVARGRLAERDGPGAPFSLADARSLPFPDQSFDCLFNSYMLDLIPTPEIPTVLAEFFRVLRPGGRLVLVNLTEGEGDDVAFSTGWKENFLKDPVSLGACRPVVVGPLMAASGFTNAERSYSGHGESWPSEIVVARRP